MAVTESASSAAIVTPEVASAYLRINNPESPILQKIINAVSDLMEQALGRIIVSRSITRYFQPRQSSHYWIPYTPVVSITSLQRLDPDDDTVDESYTSTGYWYDQETGYLEMRSGYSLWPGYRHKIVYSPGWSTVPDDIELVALRMIARRWKDHNEGEDDVRSVTVEGNTTSFDRRAQIARIREELPHRRLHHPVAG